MMGGSVRRRFLRLCGFTCCERWRTFWPLVFKNISVFFLGSDDFSPEAKRAATQAINAAFEAGWSGFAKIERLPLTAIAEAHERVEHPVGRARVILEP